MLAIQAQNVLDVASIGPHYSLFAARSVQADCAHIIWVDEFF